MTINFYDKFSVLGSALGQILSDGSIYPFWCILISQTFAYITDKSKIWVSNIVRVWRKLLLRCIHSQCNTEDNYKPINIYIILKYRPCRYFCTCVLIDLAQQLVSTKSVMKHSLCRIRHTGFSYNCLLVPLDLHFLQMLCSCQKDVPVYAGFLCNLAAVLRDRMQRTSCILLCLY